MSHVVIYNSITRDSLSPQISLSNKSVHYCAWHLQCWVHPRALCSISSGTLAVVVSDESLPSLQYHSHSSSPMHNNFVDCCYHPLLTDAHCHAKYSSLCVVGHQHHHASPTAAHWYPPLMPTHHATDSRAPRLIWHLSVRTLLTTSLYACTGLHFCYLMNTCSTLILYELYSHRNWPLAWLQLACWLGTSNVSPTHRASLLSDKTFVIPVRWLGWPVRLVHHWTALDLKNFWWMCKHYQTNRIMTLWLGARLLASLLYATLLLPPSTDPATKLATSSPYLSPIPDAGTANWPNWNAGLTWYVIMRI